MLTFIGQCIYDTRTLGGAFLWPVDAEWRNNNWNIKSKNSNYNLKRGMGSYIEDRVDLTFLEIKHFYEFFDEIKGFDEEEYKKKYKGDIILSYSDSDKIVEWLGLFGSFEKYVEFFMFHPFVVNMGNENKPAYVPIDIVNSEIKEKNEPKETSTGSFGIQNDIADIVHIHNINELKGKPIFKHKSICKGCKKDCKYKDNNEHKVEEISEIQECLRYNKNRLKRMLNNVRLLTLERSRMMTAVICGEKRLLHHWVKKNPYSDSNEYVWEKQKNRIHLNK